MYSSSPLIRAHSANEHVAFIRGVASLEGGGGGLSSIVLSAFSIWSDERGGLWWKWSNKRGLLQCTLAPIHIVQI